MDCMFYYGMEVPDLAKTQAMSNAMVIMQDYHPICHQGLFQVFFPLCRRFLYLNCAHIHRNELGKYNLNIRGMKYNPTWETYLLDLGSADAYEFILQKAMELVEIEGVDGLFLDDMDFWGENATLRATFVRLLADISKRAGREISFIFNRGFVFWHRVKNIEAIVLENMAPDRAYTAGLADLAWLQNMLRINVRILRQTEKRVPIFGLKYRENGEDVAFDKDFDDAEIRDHLYAELGKVMEKTLIYDKDFSAWPAQLQ